MNIGFGSYLKDYLENYNISQVEFAQRLDITPKHLNEILNKNIDISNDLMVAISLITDIDINFIVKIENNKRIREYLKDNYGDNLKEYIKKFDINSLEKREWVIFKHKEDEYQNAIDILNFLKVRNFSAMENIMDNIMYKKKNDSDMTKVLLWITRCNEIADKQKIEPFSKENIDKILNSLAIERNNSFCYEKIQKIFNDNGCYFVIEDTLPGTKIRGCAKVRKDKPTIYLSKMYHDKASIYFAMYHEIGHIRKNYCKTMKNYIVESNDDMEKEADSFALNEMLDYDDYLKIIDSDNIEETSRLISNNKKVPLSFIVRILAYNNKIKYNSKFYLDNIEKI